MRLSLPFRQRATGVMEAMSGYNVVYVDPVA
jgi:hypothetical protein